MSAPASARYNLTLALLILVAFALRVLLLDAQSLWYDEGVTAMVAQLNWADLTRWTANDIQPPLYYYVIALWGRLAGWSEWSLRFPSVFFGTLMVPLLAVVTQRLSRSRIAGVFVALLAALHPLLLYYSQEARMYAMLTALAILVAYALTVYADDPTRRWTLPVYVIGATAAVYTHYFAFFLLLALGIAYLTDQFVWQRREADKRIWSSIGRFAIANLVLLLLYLPWLGAMLNRFSVDNSYWQGRLKVLEALRSLFISFVSGESVAQDVAVWMLVLYAAITLLAIVALVRAGCRGRRLLTYALLWLLIPIAAVLLLTSYAPKFNPRYVLVALPGLLLIWGSGFGMKIEEQRSKNNPLDSSTSLPHLPTSLLSYFPILLLSAGFLYADINWFTDPSFRKDQWRELTTDLRQNVQPHEAIVLVSGHAWPVWNYYAPDLPVVLLPDIDVLDVDYVLDFADTAAPIREAVEPLSDRPGVWLVGWQDEVVDPTGVVPVQLELAGREKGLDSRYWGIDLRRFSQIKANWIADEAPIEAPVDAVFDDGIGDVGDHSSDGAVILRGYRPGDGGELLLFWQLAENNAPTDADYWMAGETLDADGEIVAQIAERRLSDYRYPSFRWPAGRVVLGNLRPADWLGADPQPGTYTFSLQVYDANQPAVTSLALPDGETTLTLGPIEVVVD